MRIWFLFIYSINIIHPRLRLRLKKLIIFNNIYERRNRLNFLFYEKITIFDYEKIFKMIPLGLLVLPVMSGCGAKKVKVPSKAMLMSEDMFFERIEDTLDASVLGNEDAILPSAVMKFSRFEKSVTTQKRGKKVIDKEVFTATGSGIEKYDSANHIVSVKSKSVEKDEDKFYKDKNSETEKEFTNQTIERYYGPDGTGIGYYDHIAKTYRNMVYIPDGYSYEELLNEEAKDAIYEMGTEFFMYNFRRTETSNITYKYNDNTYYVEAKDTYFLDADEVGAMYRDSLYYGGSGGAYTLRYTCEYTSMITLIDGKWEAAYYMKSTTTENYIKNTYSYAIGDVEETETEEYGKLECKYKKVNLKSTKTSKYRDLSEDIR